MDHTSKHHFWALVYVACGMGHGLVVAAAHQRAEDISAAQVLLVGFILSLVYGVIHKLWLFCSAPFIHCPSALHFLLHIHRAGALTMFSALLLLFGEVFLDAQLEPALAFVAIVALIGILSIPSQMIVHAPSGPSLR